MIRRITDYDRSFLGGVHVRLDSDLINPWPKREPPPQIEVIPDGAIRLIWGLALWGAAGWVVHIWRLAGWVISAVFGG